jgi:hypothetical protein
MLHYIHDFAGLSFAMKWIWLKRWANKFTTVAERCTCFYNLHLRFIKVR